MPEKAETEAAPKAPAEEAAKKPEKEAANAEKKAAENKEKTEEVITSTRIEIRPDGSVMLRRMGGIVSDMLFIEGKETKTIYQIPPYKFDMTLTTKKIRTSFTDKCGELQLIYSMNVGGGQKNARMKITYKSKD